MEDFIFGVQAITESLKARKNLDKIIIQRDLGKGSRLHEILEMAELAKIPVIRVPIEKLDRVTRKNHQGVIAFLGFVDYVPLSNVIAQDFEEGRLPLILILDRLTDVRNFGAICRTAEVAGVSAIVIPERGAAQINGEAFKTSSGALSFLPLCREPNLIETVKLLQNSGLQIVACTEKTKDSIYQIDFNVPTAIILGSEEDGISPELLRLADNLGCIPQFGQVQSLNVSVASGIIIYEAIRQRLVG